MACREDITIMIPEQYSSSTSSSYPSPPTVTSSNHSESSDPPTHRLILPLDRVGVTQEPIGPKRRSRRGCQPRTPQQQARSVARRNARERRRVKLVNQGFAALRDHIPPHLGVATTPSPPSKGRGADSSSKKLSKVETLRGAIEYIKQLQDAIGYDDKDSVGASIDDFSSSPQQDTSSSPSYCTSPSPVTMLMESAVHHTPMFEDDENDDFFNIVDWTTL